MGRGRGRLFGWAWQMKTDGKRRFWAERGRIWGWDINTNVLEIPDLLLWDGLGAWPTHRVGVADEK